MHQPRIKFKYTKENAESNQNQVQQVDDRVGVYLRNSGSLTMKDSNLEPPTHTRLVSMVDSDLATKQNG